MSDNVLPAVLRKLGILVLSESLASHIDSRKTLPPGDEEVELRLCAVWASHLIIEEAKRRNVPHIQNTTDLDNYLWNKGKEPGFREVERHSTTDTVFY